MTMKENQNGNSFNSISFGKETDPLIFGSKDRYELNDSRMDANLTELKAKDTDDCSDFKVTDDYSMGNENGTMGSPKKAAQNRFSHHPSMDNENGTVGSPRKETEGLSHQLSNWDKDTDSLSSYSSDTDKEQRSPEHESFGTVEEFADCNQSDSRDSSSPFFTEKNVLECDPAELEVCDKDIDFQIPKDICIDEGNHQKDVNVIESCSNEKPGCLYPQQHNDLDHFEAEEDSSLDVNSFTSDQGGRKQENENDGKTLVSKERLDSSRENSLEMDIAETGKAYFNATGKAETDSLGEDTHIDRKLPIEDLGTQSSLVRDGGNKAVQVPDQVLNQEAIPESSAAPSSEAVCAGNDVQANCPLYNGEVEERSIAFNIVTDEGVVVGSGMAEDVDEDVKAENPPDAKEAKVQCTSNVVDDSHRQSLTSNEDVDEQSSDLGNVHKDLNAENLPDAKEGVQCTINRVDDERNSDGGSATSYEQCVRGEDCSCENAHEGSTDHKQAISDEIPTANDAVTAETIAPNHDERATGDVPVLGHLQHDMGETSFSAASMVSYSGPVAFSGSLSHRSDGSTTSGRSFAFPILQSEWNSSPVRMAKADRRHFRKQKGWRSGLLCCRF